MTMFAKNSRVFSRFSVSSAVMGTSVELPKFRSRECLVTVRREIGSDVHDPASAQIEQHHLDFIGVPEVGGGG
jgi:hypothetical protein